MNPPPRYSTEELLDQVEWARDLARRLVADEATADDVVQDTFAIALTKPPRAEGPLRPWLRRVLGNRVRERARGERRRHAREQSTAKGEALPSTVELFERADSQRLLMDAVAQLSDASREVVLLRYFEGLSAAEIARRKGAPEGTIRARLKRALDELRVRLDARFDGDSSAWRAALLPLASIPVSKPVAVGLGTLLSGALLMKSVLAVVGIVLVGCVLVLSGIVDWPGSRPVVEAVSFSPMPELVAPAFDGTDAAKGGRVAAEGERSAHEAGEKLTLGPSEGRVRMRFVDEFGRPLAGVTASAFPFVELVRATSGPDGRAVVTAIFGPADSSASLRFRCPGFAADGLEVRGQPGADIDVGDVLLTSGGAIVGRVVDEDGRGLADARVWVEGVRVERMSGGLIASSPSALGATESRTDAEGNFRLTGVVAGEVQVQTETDDQLYSGTSGLVEVRSGEESRGLVIGAPRIPNDRLVEGLVVDPDGDPIPGALVRVRWSSFFRNGTNGTGTNSEGRFRIVLDSSVSVDLELRDPKERFEPIFAEDLEPSGTEHVYRFEASETFLLELTGPEGTPVSDALVVVLHDEDELQRARESETRGTYELRLPKRRFDVRVEAPGFALGELVGLEPGDVDDRIAHRLRPLPGIGGLVVADGRPVAASQLTVRELAQQKTRIMGLPSRVANRTSAQGESDAAGQFELTLRESGRFVLRAEAPGFAAFESEPFDYDPEVGRTGLTLELSSGGAIEGRVVESANRKRSHIVLLSNGDGTVRSVRTDLEGHYRADALAPGPWMVRLTDREVVLGTGHSSTEMGRPDRVIDGDCIVIAGATTTYNLFEGPRPEEELVVEGHLTFEGVDPSTWSVELVSRSMSSVTSKSRVTVRPDGDGRFTISGTGAGSHVLLLRGEEGSGLVVATELELVHGVNEFALELAFASVSSIEGDPAPEHRLLWRGAGTTFALAPIPTDGESIDFPAGTIERVRPSVQAADFGDARTWPVLEGWSVLAGESLQLRD